MSPVIVGGVLSIWKEYGPDGVEELPAKSVTCRGPMASTHVLPGPHAVVWLMLVVELPWRTVLFVLGTGVPGANPDSLSVPLQLTVTLLLYQLPLPPV